MSFLRKILRIKPKLVRLARRDDLRPFMELLHDSEIYIVVNSEMNDLDPSTITQDSLLSEVERVAKELDSANEFYPFIYELDGLSRYPFFVDMSYAQEFAGYFCRKQQQVLAFQVVSIKGSLLARYSSNCDLFVMNDRSEDEITLNNDARAMMELWHDD